MKPYTAEGRAIDSEFSVEEGDDGIVVYLESRSGGDPPRNTDYNLGLRTLLKRLQEEKASVSVLLASAPALQHEDGDRTVLDETDLSGTDDLEALQADIQSSAAAALREEGAEGSGNNTKRLELRVNLPSGATRRRLERRLARRPVRPPVLKVFFGPPGTGKTYGAAREAVRIVDGELPADGEVRRRHDELVDEGRIFWVTFHPSYSYEDFVEGFRPVRSSGGEPEFQVVDGPFKQACNAARPVLQLGDMLLDGNGREKYEVVHVDSGGVVLESEVTRGDRVTPEQRQYVDFWTVDEIRRQGIRSEQLSVPGKDNSRRQEVAKLTKFPTTLLNSSHLRAVFEAVEEHDRDEQEVVLVIDEINRADLSRVFGELITLLEGDKRRGATEETRVLLPYSKAPFQVPRGLSVVATMNTADRSLSVFDLALRRRFDFVEVPPDAALCPQDYGGIDVEATLHRWNRRIAALLSTDMTIGHSELMEAKLEALRAKRGWEADDEGRAQAVAAVVREKVLPLLTEYFHGDPRRVVFCIGSALLEMDEFGDLDLGGLEDLGMDPEELSGFRVPEWWNPDGRSWDAERFVEALKGEKPGDLERA